MQPVNSSSVFYAPQQAPNDASQLSGYLMRELASIQTAIGLLAAGHLDKSYAAPTKPRDGDIRYADGTNWNPGSGQGVYYFNGSIWKLLG